MLSYQEGLEKARTYLEDIRRRYNVEDTFVIIEEATIEKLYGWVFFYDSEEYLRTTNPSLRLAGNAPILVLRNGGKIVITTTSEPIEDYLRRFEQDRIKKFHFDEILLILFICASNISQYEEGDLVNFTEAIEGRVEDLFEVNYLRNLEGFFQPTESIIQYFDSLRTILIGMYEGQWHNKMNENDLDWQSANSFAKKLLHELNINYIEPTSFMDNEEYLDP